MQRFAGVLAVTFGTALLLAACADDGTSAGTGGGSGTDLTITVTLDEGVTPDVWQLTCEPAGGDHPDPEGACAFLQSAADAGLDPFAPVPEDTLCTQEFRGPATATVVGTWNGASVDASYNLTNGCEIARWDVAEPLLGPIPVAN